MLSCWVVTDGKAGMESQCIGLAEAIGVQPVVKRVTLRPFWRAVTPYLRFGGAAQFAANSDPLTPPWPDLLIATGRQSVAAALWVRKMSRGRTRCVQVQNPGIAWRRFDLIIAPEHDRLRGANVVGTRGALHRVTPMMLNAHAAKWEPEFAALPEPHVAVLIGGSNSVYRLEAEQGAELGRNLARAAASRGGSLLITPSRRTGDDAIRALASEIRNVPHYLWDMRGDNPYFGILAVADYIVVTCDSVNMVSEAASTGKPVFVAGLPGGSAKSRRFLDGLRTSSVIRDFTGEVAPYTYTKLDDMARIAARVRDLLGMAAEPQATAL